VPEYYPLYVTNGFTLEIIVYKYAAAV